jgi:hypothetical protein
VMGTAVQRVPDLPLNLDLAMMRSIQADNYKFIRYMIMSGWAPTNPAGCSFPLSINRGFETEEWKISQATPLHYAVCSGSLQAASALLIAFPEFASMSCKVETVSARMPQTLMWTTLDLTDFFAYLYMSLDSGRHLAFRQASSVLLQLQQDPDRLPFMRASTPSERLEQAGKNPSLVLSPVLEAASLSRREAAHSAESPFRSE